MDDASIPSTWRPEPTEQSSRYLRIASFIDAASARSIATAGNIFRARECAIDCLLTAPGPVFELLCELAGAEPSLKAHRLSFNAKLTTATLSIECESAQVASDACVRIRSMVEIDCRLEYDRMQPEDAYEIDIESLPRRRFLPEPRISASSTAGSSTLLVSFYGPNSIEQYNSNRYRAIELWHLDQLAAVASRVAAAGDRELAFRSLPSSHRNALAAVAILSHLGEAASPLMLDVIHAALLRIHLQLRSATLDNDYDDDGKRDNKHNGLDSVLLEQLCHSDTATRVLSFTAINQNQRQVIDQVRVVPTPLGRCFTERASISSASSSNGGHQQPAKTHYHIHIQHALSDEQYRTVSAWSRSGFDISTAFTANRRLTFDIDIDDSCYELYPFSERVEGAARPEPPTFEELEQAAIQIRWLLMDKTPRYLVEFIALLTPRSSRNQVKNMAEGDPLPIPVLVHIISKLARMDPELSHLQATASRLIALRKRIVQSISLVTSEALEKLHNVCSTLCLLLNSSRTTDYLQGGAKEVLVYTGNNLRQKQHTLTRTSAQIQAIGTEQTIPLVSARQVLSISGFDRLSAVEFAQLERIVTKDDAWFQVHAVPNSRVKKLERLRRALDLDVGRDVHCGMRHLARSCIAGTQREQRRSIESWLESDSANVLWLSGDKGCGKSTLLASMFLAETQADVPGRPLACLFSFPFSQQPVSLSSAVRGWCWRLACLSTEFLEAVLQVVQSDPFYLLNNPMAVNDECQRLLIDPMCDAWEDFKAPPSALAATTTTLSKSTSTGTEIATVEQAAKQQQSCVLVLDDIDTFFEHGMYSSLPQPDHKNPELGNTRTRRIYELVLLLRTLVRGFSAFGHRVRIIVSSTSSYHTWMSPATINPSQLPPISEMAFGSVDEPAYWRDAVRVLRNAINPFERHVANQHSAVVEQQELEQRVETLLATDSSFTFMVLYGRLLRHKLSHDARVRHVLSSTIAQSMSNLVRHCIEFSCSIERAIANELEPCVKDSNELVHNTLRAFVAFGTTTLSGNLLFALLRGTSPALLLQAIESTMPSLLTVEAPSHESQDAWLVHLDATVLSYLGSSDSGIEVDSNAAHSWIVQRLREYYMAEGGLETKQQERQRQQWPRSWRVVNEAIDAYCFGPTKLIERARQLVLTDLADLVRHTEWMHLLDVHRMAGDVEGAMLVVKQMPRVDSGPRLWDTALRSVLNERRALESVLGLVKKNTHTSSPTIQFAIKYLERLSNAIGHTTGARTGGRAGGDRSDGDGDGTNRRVEGNRGREESVLWRNLQRYITRNDVDSAMVTLRRMRTIGVDGEPGTYTALINCCTKTKDTRRAREIVRFMESGSVVPNVITYSSLINCCRKAMDFDLALSVYHSMPIPPNERTFTVLLPCARSYEQLMSLWSDLENRFGLRATGFSYTPLIARLCSLGRREEAFHYADLYLKSGMPWLESVLDPLERFFPDLYAPWFHDNRESINKAREQPARVAEGYSNSRWKQR